MNRFGSITKALTSAAGSMDVPGACRRGLLLLSVCAIALGCGSTDANGPVPDGGSDGTAGGDGTATDGVVKPDSPPADFGICPSYPEAGAAPTDCAGCVDALCKDESSACSADPNCVKQVTCFAACKTSACEADCLSTFPSTAGKARFDCIRCRCEKQCTSTTG